MVSVTASDPSSRTTYSARKSSTCSPPVPVCAPAGRGENASARAATSVASATTAATLPGSVRRPALAGHIRQLRVGLAAGDEEGGVGADPLLGLAPHLGLGPGCRHGPVACRGHLGERGSLEGGVAGDDGLE